MSIFQVVKHCAVDADLYRNKFLNSSVLFRTYQFSPPCKNFYQSLCKCFKLGGLNIDCVISKSRFIKVISDTRHCD